MEYLEKKSKQKNLKLFQSIVAIFEINSIL